MAIQLTEIKKQEYFAQKEHEQYLNQKIELREIKNDDSKENDIEIKSPNEEVHPLETTITGNGTVAINYY